jgi:VIT1/CCC1 family predicted Fe2+/Mn2+ transporter
MKLTDTHERLLVSLISLHSTIVGAMFMLAPQWTLRFAGWPGIDPVFFAYQAGVFHFVLAAAYLLEYHRYRGVSVLMTAKITAFVFLISATIIDPIPWAVWTSGILDGAMALVVWWVHRAVARPTTPVA